MKTYTLTVEQLTHLYDTAHNAGYTEGCKDMHNFCEAPSANREADTYRRDTVEEAIDGALSEGEDGQDDDSEDDRSDEDWFFSPND